jgi:hypothetical protein
MKKLLPFLALTLALAASLVPLATGAPTAQTVRVTATPSESLVLSTRPKSGVVRFVVRNVSGDEHDFWLKGGGRTTHTALLSSGRSATVTMRLKRGVVYRFWCSVGDHAQEGMAGSFRAR